MVDTRMFDVAELWKPLAENSFDGVMFVDPDQKVIYWNCQAARITGFSAEEVVGQSCLVGIRCPTCLRRCGLFTRGDICDRTMTLVTRSGREITVVKNAQVIHDSDGHVVGGIEVFRRLRGNQGRRSMSDEEALIRDALMANKYSRSQTAKSLGMSRATLWRKMKKYDL